MLILINKCKTIFFIVLILFPINLFSQPVSKYKIRKIVIDAGHGGKDPGAIGKKAYEKDIALAIALKLGKYIEKNIDDIEIIYTRTTDVFIELHRRAEIANSNKADLFISIHANSNKSSKPKGTSTYVMGLNRSEENIEVALAENSVIYSETDYKQQYEDFDPEAAESYITMSLLQNAFLEQSLIIAGKVQEQFAKRAGRKDIGVRQAGLIVLWNCTMPSILVETGFISNREEEKYLISDEGQSFIASAIYRAFREYKTQIENAGNFIASNNNSNDNSKNQTKTGNIVFKVQIKTSVEKLKLDSKEFKGIDDVEEIMDNKIAKYYVGNCTSYDEVVKLQSDVRKKISDAFVVAFKNGKKITVKEALEEINK